MHFKPIPEDLSAIRKMTDAMAHRGPDADGFFDGGELALGHRRLSIIDLSDAANQPFTDNSGRFVIVFNGEIYNYREVRSSIKDYDFRTGSDTEVLLAAYIKWGPEGLLHFRGMFAFAIWDKQEKELFMARDPMGVKPLYYFIDKDKLLFASELRSILATGLVKRVADPLALIDYFSYQSVSYPRSIIQGICQLEAGSWMRIRDGQSQKKTYFDVTRPAAGPGSAYRGRAERDGLERDGAERRIRELMMQSIERRLVSDVPVGAFLSGGIDSAAVVGLMAAASSERPNTFNVSFEEKAFDESVYADLIAKKFNTRHTRITLRSTVFLDELQNALDALDTPSGDGINTYVVSKAIRRSGIKVALSGVGGDELFAGYPFFSHYLALQKRSWLWKMPPAIRKMLAIALPGGGSDGRTGRVKQLLRLDDCSIDHAYPVFRQLLSPDRIHRLSSLAKTGGFSTSVEQELGARKARLADLPLLSQVSAAEYLGYTQNTLLKDTDQMSMAVSLEVREPFFDQDLVEYVLAIPDHLKNPVYPKSLLVESLKPLLPDEVVFRKKQGFLFPWNVWLKQDLRSFCDRYIQQMAARSFIQGENLIAYWQRFLAGDKTVRWAEIWLFVVLEYWMEKNQVE